MIVQQKKSTQNDFTVEEGNSKWVYSRSQLDLGTDASTILSNGIWSHNGIIKALDLRVFEKQHSVVGVNNFNKRVGWLLKMAQQYL